MALTDILAYGGKQGINEMSRGNIGTLSDALSLRKAVQEEKLVVPVVGDVKSGVQYGVNGNQLTGTYVGGGGGNIFVLVD